MKKFLKISLSVLLAFILVIAGGIFYLFYGLSSGENLDINAADLRSVSDGTYSGKYNAGRWTNELNVTVKDHRITKIDVVKDVTFPKPEWTAQLFEEVIDTQNIDIDAITGATVTSKAYLKSIENALTSNGR
jgi:uncharacterized protein with FMN-binding domain